MVEPLDSFPRRHLGSSARDVEAMLAVVGAPSLDALVGETIPAGIRLARSLALPPARGEHGLLEELRSIAARNEIFRSFIGAGYSETITPSVILRNVLQNPGWYTAYTPYQAEISQGRLEALLDFQTAIADLTGLPVANASLLDEGTAAAEAMQLLRTVGKARPEQAFFVSDACHPQTIAVVRARAKPLGIEVLVGDAGAFDFGRSVFGALVQYPATDGALDDPRAFVERAHAHGALVAAAVDPLALTLLVPPGELGFDVAVGSSQRFGVPLGFGGPHAAFFATREAYARAIPGRIIGVSRDADGRRALRMALQTREQHIRREKATSNICTSQVLLAVMAGLYAVYHGPEGLKAIAAHCHALARAFAAGLGGLGLRGRHAAFFDTVAVSLRDEAEATAVCEAAAARRMNVRRLGDGRVAVAFGEPATPADVAALLRAFAEGTKRAAPVDGDGEALYVEATRGSSVPAALRRASPFLTHPTFHRYHTEHELLRYVRALEAKDLSLTRSMIPLGSCTMKLNATSELEPLTWREFSALHPFAPREQWRGYQQIFDELEAALAEITGFAACSLMPNSGAAGEYAGLLAIRAYHASRGEGHRSVCLIPASAHGTNPASAVMAGLEVVVVRTEAFGNVDVGDLRAKLAEHGPRVAALMLTYPSTHGVFEAAIADICGLVHAVGAQVYLDGANMNAQVGLCRPGDYGADVCHLNLHKTFAIPHGGGGPGVGPICVAPHLAPFLPRHPLAPARESEAGRGAAEAPGPVAAAPYGSASVLLISWMYLRLMGAEGLAQASRLAILNANYVAERLQAAYPVLYRGERGRVAHECIVDMRGLKAASGVEVEDVAKRLMDYGFHAPTVSFPVASTMMIEPTESESKAELDRFCEALLAIREEIAEIERGAAPKAGNVLKGAPHTAEAVCADEWARPYSRRRAAYPLPWVKERKFWPSVSRIDNVHGDRQLFCACPPVTE